MDSDLSKLFPSANHPSIKERIDYIETESDEIIRLYKGKIKENQFTDKDVIKLLKHLEDIYSELNEIVVFSSLSFAADMTKEENKQLDNKVKNLSALVRKKLSFFQIELGKLLQDKPSLLNNTSLKNYRCFLSLIKRRTPHLLSGDEESLIIEKDRFGVNEWEALRSKLFSLRKFEIEIKGEIKTVDFSYVSRLLQLPDRSMRTAAYKAIYKLQGQDELIFPSILSNICSDWVQISKKRQYKTALHSSLISNEVDEEIILNMEEVIKENIGIFHRYLQLKARILKIPKLGCQDLDAQITDVSPDLSWSKTTRMVREAYRRFDASYCFAVDDMLDKNHIDALPREGKLVGGFCTIWYKGKSAFIHQFFKGLFSNAYSLAHELGHATHFYLSSQKQTYFNARVPSVMAETAATFGELLLTDYLLNIEESQEKKLMILGMELDNSGLSIYDINTRYWFEKSMYETIEKGQILDANKIKSLWKKSRDIIYGDTIEWLEESDWEWISQPHYYFANYRYYNYPYAFGYLFTYALYQIYKSGKEEGFVNKFMEMLSAGGSKSPEELGKMMGVNIREKDFWKLGIKQFEKFVDELEKLVK